MRAGQVPPAAVCGHSRASGTALDGSRQAPAFSRGFTPPASLTAPHGGLKRAPWAEWSRHWACEDQGQQPMPCSPGTSAWSLGCPGSRHSPHPGAARLKGTRANTPGKGNPAGVGSRTNFGWRAGPCVLRPPRVYALGAWTPRFLSQPLLPRCLAILGSAETPSCFLQVEFVSRS